MSENEQDAETEALHLLDYLHPSADDSGSPDLPLKEPRVMDQYRITYTGVNRDVFTVRIPIGERSGVSFDTAVVEVWEGDRLQFAVSTDRFILLVREKIPDGA